MTLPTGFLLCLTIALQPHFCMSSSGAGVDSVTSEASTSWRTFFQIPSCNHETVPHNSTRRQALLFQYPSSSLPSRRSSLPPPHVPWSLRSPGPKMTMAPWTARQSVPVRRRDAKCHLYRSPSPHVLAFAPTQLFPASSAIALAFLPRGLDCRGTQTFCKLILPVPASIALLQRQGPIPSCNHIGIHEALQQQWNRHQQVSTMSMVPPSRPGFFAAHCWVGGGVLLPNSGPNTPHKHKAPTSMFSATPLSLEPYNQNVGSPRSCSGRNNCPYHFEFHFRNYGF